MTHDEVIRKLNTTFCEVFDDDIELSDETTAADIEGWDSLTNVRLLVQIELDFDISFSSYEIADISNVGELANIIVSRF